MQIADDIIECVVVIPLIYTSAQQFNEMVGVPRRPSELMMKELCESMALHAGRFGPDLNSAWIR